MGQEILYCHKCGQRLIGDDFTRGRAHTFNNRQYCSKCLPQEISTGAHQAIKDKPRDVSTASHRAIKDRPRDVSTASHRAIKDAPPGSRSRMRPGTTRSTRAVSPRSNLPVVILGVVGLAIVLVTIIVAVTNSKTVDPPPDPITKSAPLPPPETPKTATPKVDPAKIAAELKELDDKVQSLVKNEQFGGALDLLTEARKRRDVNDWTYPIKKKFEEVEAIPARLYPDLRQKGLTAQLRGATAEVQPLRARLGTWGKKDLIDDFDRMIKETIPHEDLPAGATVLVQYPNPDRSKYTPLGDVVNDSLVGVERFGGPCVGFESGRDILTIPTEGEVRVVYTTTNPTMLTVVLRATAPDGKNYPFNFWLHNPVQGKPQLLKCSLSVLKDWQNNLITKGAVVNNIYVRQEGGAGNLTVHEFVIFKTKD